MDLLQEGDLLLQRLDSSLQVQAGQSGSVHVLQQFVLSDVVSHVLSQTHNKNNNSQTHRSESSQAVLCFLLLEDLLLQSETESQIIDRTNNYAPITLFNPTCSPYLVIQSLS